MALGFNEGTSSGGSGDFLPIIKYDARAGRFFRVDRAQGPNGWESNSTDITDGFQAIFDLEAIEVGWLDFANGRPDIVTVLLGHGFPARPSEAHKQGFRLRVKLGKSIDGGSPVREFTSSAAVVRKAIDALHDAFLIGLNDEYPSNKGKVPLVKFVKSVGIKSGEGAKSSTNYAPVFEIVKWVDRPDGLPVPVAPMVNMYKADSTKPASTPPATGSKVATPPAVSVVGFSDGEDDFG